jgi:hypothetical protein
MLACSLGVHPRIAPDPLVPLRAVLRPGRLPGTFGRQCSDGVIEGNEVQWTRHPQRAGECLSTYRTLKALRIGMHVRAPARQPPFDIRNTGSGYRDDPHQF